MSSRWWLCGAAGAAAGVAGWITWASAIPSIPIPLRFIVAFGVFVVGPGAALAAALARDVDAIERRIIPLSAGLVLSPAIAQVLGMLGFLGAYPAVVAALGGVAFACGCARHSARARAVAARDLAACALAGVLALGGGVVAYAHRMSPTPDGITVHGDYDTFDSTYYAAMSGELANHIPPDAPFRAGHRLGYAYHPQLLLAMVHRFGGVPLLDLYLRYAWPAFLVITSLTIFMTMRRIASTGVALLGICLVLFGSDLSYIAEAFRPSGGDWDRIIWANNWLTPGAEQLFFNTWTPALAVLFLGFWMLDRCEGDRRLPWLLAAAACFGSLVQFKPFGFAAVMAGLVAAAVFAGANRSARKRFLAMFVASLVLALPYLYGALTVYDESQAVLRAGSGYGNVLPRRVIAHVGLEPALADMSRPFGGGATATALLSIIVANVLFVVGGLGARLIALPGLWRILKGKDAGSVWRLLAWTIVAGAAFPLVVVTEPNHQTFHTYHTSLFLLWIVAARDVLRWTRHSWWARGLLVAAVLIAALPSTVHYLRLKWTDPLFGHINRDTFTVADRLRQEDFARTVLLHRYPQGPSFVALLAERRTVLAWAQYARASAPVAEEVDQFFQSADGNAAGAWSTLIRYRVTHVVETVGRDHIHADVLCRLRPLLVTRTLKLYAVAAQIVDRCRDGTESVGEGTREPIVPP